GAERVAGAQLGQHFNNDVNQRADRLQKQDEHDPQVIPAATLHEMHQRESRQEQRDSAESEPVHGVSKKEKGKRKKEKERCVGVPCRPMILSSRSREAGEEPAVRRQRGERTNSRSRAPLGMTRSRETLGI